MKLVSEIINTDVFAENEGIVFGKVKNLIIDPASGSFIALQVYGKGIKKKRSLISSLAIKHLDQDIIVVESIDDAETSKKLPGPYKILNEKISILGSKVSNEEGVILGRVADFALETNIGQLSRIYVARRDCFFFFSKTLIFSYLQIVEIQKGKIIVAADPAEMLGETASDILA